MFSDNYQQRLKTLFTDLEGFSTDPANGSTTLHHKLETLRVRLLELEAQFLESETRAVQEDVIPNNKEKDTQSHAATPMLYEAEKLGYAFRNDMLEFLNELPKAGSNASGALAAPLVASGKAIGEIQIESSSQRSWSQEETQLANSVAQQASLQIQNLRLLSATERSRAEAETATRRFMHEGWESYLDAINRNERIGFAFDQSSVTAYTDILQPNGGVQELINVMDEQVGVLSLKPDPNHPLTDADKTLVSGVASLIAQQVENIRLLADASRARAEAENAIRRLTRENWETFTENHDETNRGFVYDLLKVTPLGDNPFPENVVLSKPLMVRGETVGQLAVAGWKKVSPEAEDLATTIAAQASIHLETLRLNEELQKRARELQELDRLKSAFLANMSHELRTPLNSILGFADVMLEEIDGPLTENMSNDLGLIQKNGQHLLHLINDVLDMAKIESGKMNLTLEKFRIHEIFEEVTSITSTLASEKNLALFINPDSDKEVEVNADRTRLRQVMINLVNNSIKFTEKGKISISAARYDDEHILISVRDTGLGIPTDKLEAVFQEFTQVDTSTTRKTGGTGLGLPISRRLVTMHGGELWAESSGIEGEGSTFYVKLPLEAKISEADKQESIEK